MKKILIVDDELLIRFSLSKTFLDVAEVTTSETGKEACDEIRSSFYDLCILDLNLPDMNGLQVMENILSRSPRIKVILLTAYADEKVRKVADGKAFMILEKPFDLSEIKQWAGFMRERNSA